MIVWFEYIRHIEIEYQLYNWIGQMHISISFFILVNLIDIQFNFLVKMLDYIWGMWSIQGTENGQDDKL